MLQLRNSLIKKATYFQSSNVVKTDNHWVGHIQPSATPLHIKQFSLSKYQPIVSSIPLGLRCFHSSPSLFQEDRVRTVPLDPDAYKDPKFYGPEEPQSWREKK